MATDPISSFEKMFEIVSKFSKLTEENAQIMNIIIECSKNIEHKPKEMTILSNKINELINLIKKQNQTVTHLIELFNKSQIEVKEWQKEFVLDTITYVNGEKLSSITDKKTEGVDLHRTNWIFENKEMEEEEEE